MIPAQPIRTGIALILAIVILTALMLMGLPFLFSQSAGLGGARVYRDSQRATVAAQQAERMAMAVAIYAQHNADAPSDSTTTTAVFPRRYTSLKADTLAMTVFGLTDVLTSPFANTAFGTEINTTFRAASTSPVAFVGINSSSITTGISIDDESGKLDPNFMSVAAWDRLLDAVKIPDWDDNDAVHNHGSMAVDPLHPPALIFTPQNDSDHFGELAAALAMLPGKLPGWRITELDQLLQADTGYGTAGTPAGITHYDSTDLSTFPPFGLRRRLTRAELEQLRPFLTIHQPPNGRNGRIDFGTVVKGELNVRANSHDQAGITIFDTLDLPIGVGTRIESQLDGDSKPSIGMVQSAMTASDGTALNGNIALTFFDRSGVATTHQRFGLHDTPLSLLAPTPVNINGAAGPVAKALQLPGPSTGIRTRGVSGLATITLTAPANSPFNGLPPTAWSLTYPLTLSAIGSSLQVEMPPLTIESTGVVTIHARAAALDPLGNIASQRFQDTTVQAINPNQPIERRWITQDQMKALIDQRYGANATAWPNPIKRVNPTPNKPTSFPDETPGTPQTSIRAKIRPAPTIPGVEPDFNYEGTNSTQLVDGNGAAIDPLASSSVQLTPDGVKVLAPVAFNAKFDAQTNPKSVLGTTDEIGARRLSFWIRADEGGWSGQVPLFDLRTPEGNCGLPVTDFGLEAVDPKSQHALYQNRLALWYDPAAMVLALIIAPPTIEQSSLPSQSTGIGPWIGLDDPATPDLDERCLGFGYDPLKGLPVDALVSSPWLTGTLSTNPATMAKRLAPAPATGLHAWCSLLRSNHIVHLWSLAGLDSAQPDFFAKGHWHKIEVVMAAPKLGGITMIVDGIVGEDARESVHGLIDYGAHLTLPAMSLSSVIEAKPVTSLNDLDQKTIEVEPILLPNEHHLNASDIFPARGALRIDRECFEYQSIVDNTFKGVWRGQRQDTDVTNPMSPSAWPITERHSPFTPVVPLGYRLQPASGILYRGGCVLADKLPGGDPNPPNANLHFRIWCPLATAGPGVTAPPVGSTTYTWDPSTGVIPVDSSRSDLLDNFPDQGVVCVGKWDETQGDVHGRIYTYAKKTAQGLEGVAPLPSGSFSPPGGLTASRLNTASVTYTAALDDTNRMIFLISLRVKSDDNAKIKRLRDPGRYADFGLIQVTDPISGRVEWIAYDAVGDLVLADGSTQSFFLTKAASGWFIDSGQISGQPSGVYGANGNRGQARTDCPGRAALPHNTQKNNFVWNVADDVEFPIASLVIPIQTAFQSNNNGGGHLVGIGDLVTILPRANPQSRRPIQAVVRFATTDGYVVDATKPVPSGPNNDTVGGWFAFDRALDDSLFQDASGIIAANAINAVNFEMLHGTCWGADHDLSPLDKNPGKQQANPRLDLMSSPLLSIASVINPVSGESSLASDATVDQVSGGFVPLVSHLARYDGTDLILGEDSALYLDASLTMPRIWIESGALPAGTSPNANMGLVSIGGEVFAYQRATSLNTTPQMRLVTMNDGDKAVIGTPTPQWTQLTLLGRGLLGSRAVSHALGEPVVWLPIGPVAQIAGSGDDGTDGTLIDQRWMKFDDGTSIQPPSDPANPKPIQGITIAAPYLMICAPDGSKAEITTFFGPTSGRLNKRFTDTGQTSPVDHSYGIEYVTAPWTRGLFNSKRQEWSPTTMGTGTSATSLKPIVIGWWPRYAPALSDLAIQANASAAMRCRVYGRIGFPHGLFDASFDQAELKSFGWDVVSMDPITPLSGGDPRGGTGTTPLVDLYAYTAAPGQDWKPTINDQSLSQNPDIKQAFVSNAQFSNAARTGGAELRLCWRYRGVPVDPGSTLDPTKALAQLRDIAINGNVTPPAIGPVRLRCLAPVKVLATEVRR